MVRYGSWYFSILVLAALSTHSPPTIARPQTNQPPHSGNLWLLQPNPLRPRRLQPVPTSPPSTYTPHPLTPPPSPLYIAQFTLVVLAPVFIAAGDYVLFGKLLESVLPGGRRARALGVTARFVTYIFLSGDIFSFVLQGIGAGIMTGASDGSSPPGDKWWRWANFPAGTDIKKMDLGRDIMLSGLAIQILTFGFFICATIRFSFKAQDLAVPGAERPRWRVLLWALYFSSFLIMVRPPQSLGSKVGGLMQSWNGIDAFVL